MAIVSRLRLVVAGLLFLLLYPGQAGAWGDLGHRIIGAVAQQVLMRDYPVAWRKIEAMLAADGFDPLTPPDFPSRAMWADKYAQSDRDGDQAALRRDLAMAFRQRRRRCAQLHHAVRSHPSCRRAGERRAGGRLRSRQDRSIRPRATPIRRPRPRSVCSRSSSWCISSATCTSRFTSPSTTTTRAATWSPFSLPGSTPPRACTSTGTSTSSTGWQRRRDDRPHVAGTLQGQGGRMVRRHAGRLGAQIERPRPVDGLRPSPRRRWPTTPASRPCPSTSTTPKRATPSLPSSSPRPVCASRACSAKRWTDHARLHALPDRERPARS